jgi:hypothetical protein|tara:strand:- start:49 stop:792 length:744 start_codon:yes stop_codon:yes gene_type:complete
MNFKTYHRIEEAWRDYFPTAGDALDKSKDAFWKKYEKEYGKEAADADRADARETWDATKDEVKQGAAATWRGAKKAGSLAASGVDAIYSGAKAIAGAGYAPEYQKQFSAAAPTSSSPAGDILSGKTLAEIQQKVLAWRTKNITNKDGSPAALKAEQELESISGDKAGATARRIEFLDDGKFFDSGYILPGHTEPKVFDHIGHYANTVLDSMLSYAQKGYPLKDINRFLRFDKGALDLLKKHGYLYTG